MRGVLSFLTALIALLVVTGCGAKSTSAPPESAQKAFVRKVRSGDTLTLQAGAGKALEVRLYGVDAPELGQPYVGRAMRRLRELSSAKEVTFAYATAADAEPDEVLLFIDGDLTNATLLSEGLAWVKPGVRNEELVSAYNRARQNKRGLWKDSRQIPPWEFRSMRSSERTQNDKKRSHLHKKEAPDVITYQSVEGMDKYPNYYYGHPYYRGKKSAKKYNDDTAKHLNKKYKHWKTCSGGTCYESTAGGNYRKYKAGENDKSSFTKKGESEL